MALTVWVGLTLVAEKQARASDRLERLMKGAAGRPANTALLRKQDRIQDPVARAAGRTTRSPSESPLATSVTVSLAMPNVTSVSTASPSFSTWT